MFAVLRQRNFSLLWFGQLISLIGDWVLFVALPFYVYELTGSALATGMMFIAQLLPSLLLGSVAGVFADRWDRKRIMIVSDVLRGLVLLLLLFVHSAEWLWLVYLVAFMQSTIGQFFVPAKSAIIPQLVGQQDLVEANSLNAISDSLTRLIGPSLGGVLMAALGLTSVVLVDSASFLISALLIFFIALPAGKSVVQAKINAVQSLAVQWATFWREWLQGLSLIKRDRMLTGLFAVTAIFSLGDAIFTSLLVVFVKQSMHGTSQELGWLMAAQGVGGLLGGLVVSRVSKIVNPVYLIALACITDAMMLFVLFNVPVYLLAIMLIVPAGVMMVGLMVSLNTLLQSSVADQFRGRIFGAWFTSAALMRLVGVVFASTLGEVVGAVPVLNVGASLWFVAGVLVLLLLPVRASEAHVKAQPEQAQVNPTV